jgi:hypothetical protein
MQYLLLIYDDEATRWDAPDVERDALHGDYMKLVGELVKDKVYLGGNPLARTSTAKSVRVRRGETAVTDGPFAETREQLGGYFLVDVGSEAEAIAIAERMPGARRGTIEVRAIVPRPS